MYISSLKTAGRNTKKSNNKVHEERMKKRDKNKYKMLKMETSFTGKPRSIRSVPIRSEFEIRWDANMVLTHSEISLGFSTFLFRVRMINNKSNAKMSVMYVACQRLCLFMAWINKNNAPIRDDKLTQRQKTTTKYNNQNKIHFRRRLRMFLIRWVQLQSPPHCLPSWAQLVALELELKMFWKRFRKCRWRVRLTIMNVTPDVGWLWWSSADCDDSPITLMGSLTSGRKFRTDAATALWRLIESCVIL